MAVTCRPGLMRSDLSAQGVSRSFGCCRGWRRSVKAFGMRSSTRLLRPSRKSSGWSSIRSLSRRTDWSSVTWFQRPRPDCNHTRDKLASYGAAKGAVMPSVEHRRHKGLNNRAENSHQPTRRRERQMERFKSAGQAQRFLAAHDGINNLFHLRRDHRPARQYRAARTQAFQTWAEVTGVAARA